MATLNGLYSGGAETAETRRASDSEVGTGISVTCCYA